MFWLFWLSLIAFSWNAAVHIGNSIRSGTGTYSTLASLERLFYWLPNVLLIILYVLLYPYRLTKHYVLIEQSREFRNSGVNRVKLGQKRQRTTTVDYTNSKLKITTYLSLMPIIDVWGSCALTVIHLIDFKNITVRRILSNFSLQTKCIFIKVYIKKNFIPFNREVACVCIVEPTTRLSSPSYQSAVLLFHTHPLLQLWVPLPFSPPVFFAARCTPWAHRTRFENILWINLALPV